MTSTFLMWLLFAAYLLIASVAAIEKNLPRVGYFCGASLIILSTIYMRKS